MKKAMLILVLCSSLHAPAQKHVFLGLKGGWNSATIKATGMEYAYYLPRASFHAGGVVPIRLSKQFALQPELLYSGQGAKYRTNYQSDDVPDVAYEWRLNYLNMPFTVQYLFGNGLRLETGPQVGFLIRAKSKDKFSEQDIKGYLKKTDFSWNVGAGYRTGPGLGFDARYILGLSEIDPSTEILERNRVFQMGVFYVFGSKRN